MGDQGSNAAMLGYAQGISQNTAAIAKVLGTAFPLNAARGTFTMAAAASKTVTDASCKEASTVILQAVNAAAGTLQAGTGHLYPTAANGSFTVTTASGASAAGTEAFHYLIVNAG